MIDEFTCDLCGRTFEKEWSDEEADAEYRAMFPQNAEEPHATICDDCWTLARALFPDLFEEEQ